MVCRFSTHIHIKVKVYMDIGLCNLQSYPIYSLFCCYIRNLSTATFIHSLSGEFSTIYWVCTDYNLIAVNNIY